MEYSFIKNSEEEIDLARIYKENIDLHYPLLIKAKNMEYFLFKWEGVYKRALIRDFLVRKREGVYIPGYGICVESAWGLDGLFPRAGEDGPRFFLVSSITSNARKCISAFESAYQKYVEKNRVTITRLGVVEKGFWSKQHKGWQNENRH